jgi:spore maturation protein CgeB
MRLVIFGLTVSSSWGNGHASLWRGLLRALLADGHHVTFLERDQPFYAENRDLFELPERGQLLIYSDWQAVLPRARAALAGADAAIVTSYCPDGVTATELVLEAPIGVRCFYDMDTPVTLSRLEAGEAVSYIGPHGLDGFDVVLSFTGGDALAALHHRLGARHVVPLYGSVDPDLYHPAFPQPQYAGLLSYIGTYAADRQLALQTLLIEPALRRPAGRFVIAGAQYPKEFPWSENLFFVRHLPPSEHCGFYASCGLTLNVTRAAMARMGWCPSGRLFEAAACGTPVLSDAWEGVDAFFEPGEEILIARNAEEAMAALDLSPEARMRIGARARERVLAEHTAERRARELLAALDAARDPTRRGMNGWNGKGTS